MSFFWYSYWFYWRFIYLRRCHQFHWILAVLFESAFVIFCAILFPSMSPVVSAFFWISRVEAVLNGSEFYIWVYCVAQAFLPKLSPMFFGKHKIQRFWNKFDLWFQWNISLYTPIVNKDSQIYSVFYVQWHRVLIGKPSSNQCKGTLNEILNIFDV